MLYRMTTGGSPDEEFAAYEYVNGTLVQNSEAESDGRFRRMITTPGGIDVTFWNDMPEDVVGEVAEALDSVARVNYDAGRASKAAEIRKALEITS